MRKTILVIDDNEAVCTALELLFALQGWACVAAPDPEAGLAALARKPVDLVIQDMNFRDDTTSGEEGVALFGAIRERFPDIPVVLLTAWTSLETAVELVRAGAADYLGKPWEDAKLVTTVRNLLELGDANRKLRVLHDKQHAAQAALAQEFNLAGMVFADPATEQVVRLACQVARADVPVLITGPNGAGKERIAELVHANSRVADGPFVSVNCGALPRDLIEAELFGAEAGAYTGAAKAREGRFEAADGGTLFLDEIGNLSLEGQMKLLRVLETGQFERLGSNRTRKTNVRVVSATNADLPAMIAAGEFREDIFYRLNVIELALPPLAARGEDILPLARHFLGADKRFSPAAEEALRTHDWPGNVRELRNAVTRAKLLCSGAVVDVADLGLPGASAATVTLRSARREPSREEIERALLSAEGVVSAAAQQLGLSRQALYRRMERYGLH
ncbi:sigma-54-dependent Fis family transcriptional regulator [Mangrovimicrobium sediminis]|uniref:Sigma-54-dependent Fis family transcriptional regulator n=1 Tax=Mangrovimicrobium sediminis TaxID=2562682 RepID=A0A4Z0M2G1_9GAMM|nr:sigma-54 dependent transcriptional regulator [Haliea sp. SAOS-164]TGD73558.1 sigma-54-dependent Fis family transcriptional regulator [Haliea sp. SAOS-164]